MLKDKWLSFNPRVFSDALNVLPSIQGSAAQRSIVLQQQQSFMKKQKATLLGIPKGLAHPDPLKTFKEGRRGSVTNMGSGTIRPADGTILPKGFRRSTTRMITGIPVPTPEKLARRKSSTDKEERKSSTKDIPHKTSKSVYTGKDDILDRVNTQRIKVGINEQSTPEIDDVQSSYISSSIDSSYEDSQLVSRADSKMVDDEEEESYTESYENRV